MHNPCTPHAQTVQTRFTQAGPAVALTFARGHPASGDASGPGTTDARLVTTAPAAAKGTQGS